MNKRLLLILLSCLTAWSFIQSPTGNGQWATLNAQTTYVNPVYNWDTPDPSIQRAQDGTFYCYATACQTRKSTDLVHWTDVPNVFSRPTWNDTTYIKNGKQQTDYYNLWAADANYFGGRYVMYYASALWGNGSRTGIGVATGLTPYRFTDAGKLFRSTEIKVENSIDPVYIEEFDKKYLAWGSFNGIYITQLTDDGLQVRDMSQIKRIAGSAFEGAMIHRHGSHYYLFASIGSCCEGLNSTYRTVVGRSTNLMGPYMSKSGQLLTSNGYTVLISRNTHWVGPGHNSEIITDDEGQDWILYHAYDASDDTRGRVLMLDRLHWDEQGWPYVESGTPSFTEQPAPIFYKGDGARMDYKLQNSDFMQSDFAGWNATAESSTDFSSGLGSAFMPLMHVAGGSFSVEQSLTGLPDGLYEVSLQAHTLAEQSVQVRVGSVLTPLSASAEPLPEAAADVSKSLLRNPSAHLCHAYGLVIGGRLTLGLRGNLQPDQALWAGQVRLTRRDKNAQALQAVAPWYAQRVAEVVASPSVDDYYKNRLQGYLSAMQETDDPAQQYTALVNIHKQLDRLSALDPTYDAILAPTAPASSAPALYDLSGRPLPTIPTTGIYILNGRKVISRPNPDVQPGL
ncbi:MAG: family 43 glycosylhydrolase [Bacteroidaceae bacterium]|nr:family 43 glycosylhydrolase [Bacteroidaceae bacterium]